MPGCGMKRRAAAWCVWRLEGAREWMSEAVRPTPIGGIASARNTKALLLGGGLSVPTSAPGRGLIRANICTGTGLITAHICIGTGLITAHICIGTALTLPASAMGLGSLCPHLHPGWAYPSHICTGTRFTPAHICIRGWAGPNIRLNAFALRNAVDVLQQQCAVSDQRQREAADDRVEELPEAAADDARQRPGTCHSNRSVATGRAPFAPLVSAHLLFPLFPLPAGRLSMSSKTRRGSHGAVMVGSKGAT